jgi:hypothetical protein
MAAGSAPPKEDFNGRDLLIMVSRWVFARRSGMIRRELVEESIIAGNQRTRGSLPQKLLSGCGVGESSHQILKMSLETLKLVEIITGVLRVRPFNLERIGNDSERMRSANQGCF